MVLYCRIGCVGRDEDTIRPMFAMEYRACSGSFFCRLPRRQRVAFLPRSPRDDCTGIMVWRKGLNIGIVTTVVVVSLVSCFICRSVFPIQDELSDLPRGIRRKRRVWEACASDAFRGMHITVWSIFCRAGRRRGPQGVLGRSPVVAVPAVVVAVKIQYV